MSLGSLLHLVFPPLADTFLVGIVMAGLASVVALVGRRFISTRGSVLSISVVAALLKAASPGGAALGPMVAILAEGALMEVGLFAGGGARRAGYVLAGSLATAWGLPHKFLMMRLMYGQGFVTVALKMAKDGSALVGLPPGAPLAVLLVLLLLRLVVGAIAGWAAWDLSRAVRRRARGSPEEAA